jgi:hypothetical protein
MGFDDSEEAEVRMVEFMPLRSLVTMSGGAFSEIYNY